jgi:cell division protein FtsL
MKEVQEFIDSKKESKELKGASFKDVFNGSAITKGIMKNIHMVVWLAFLAIVYIGNRYHAEKVARDTNALQKEVNDLRAESITTAARLMNLSRQSKVAEMTRDKQLPLKESVQPPYKIKP